MSTADNGARNADKQFPGDAMLWLAQYVTAVSTGRFTRGMRFAVAGIKL